MIIEILQLNTNTSN